jgi:asparagine synthase (glutamine-hydrolysing)
MCGIVGYLKPSGDAILSKDSCINILKSINHRGPDDLGFYSDNYSFLGHTRLSIIDIFAGSQPIFNEDKTVCIIFNGEIFNYKLIKNDLVKRGHFFSTNTDTEVILHAFEEWKEACLDRLRGMFSFAIYDIKEKFLFIARDRLGIKPLYYTIINGNLYFASEIKAIFKMVRTTKEIDFNALTSFFTLSYIPSPLTIFKQIKKLPAGYNICFSNGKLSIKKYWDLCFRPELGKSESFFIERLKELLEESVSLHMIGDVPIGAFLSGGIDSGVIVALMSELSNSQVHTFCLGYGGETGGFLDERKYAKLIASRYKTNHEEIEVQPDIESVIAEIIESFDEPFADASTIPSYYLSRQTKRKVTVALSGLGGDELFGGYERYLGYKLSRYYNIFPLFIRKHIVEQIVNNLPERSDGHYTVNHLKRFVRAASLSDFDRYFGFISMLNPDKLASLFNDRNIFYDGYNTCKELIFNYFNADNAIDSMDKVLYTDIKTYLPEDILACTDRTSMWHSLEVRVPFLDHKLMEFCATIPNSLKIHRIDKKYLLKKAYSTYLHKDIIKHRKQGFIGPMTKWLQEDLKHFVSNTLSESKLNKHGLFNKKFIQKIVSEHNNRIEMNDKIIWALIIFQVWYEKYILNDSNS